MITQTLLKMNRTLFYWKTIGLSVATIFITSSLIAQTIQGTVFEDANYGGGAGRNLIASNGTAIANARVELYDLSGNYLDFTTTNVAGSYSFGPLANAIYQVRVVNQSVSSGRPGWVVSLFPVQTFRTDASVGGIVTDVTDRVGGEIPAEQDAPENLFFASLGGLNGIANQEVQSVTTVDLTAGGNITNIDFGFNFDLIVNINNSGQGSFRQFVLNANALGDESLLAQNGFTWNAIDSVNAAIALPAQRETSIFMIADGNAHAGLRAGLTNLLSGGVAIITPLTTVLTITGANSGKTNIDGGTQTANIGNSNFILLGTGGTVGTGPDAVAGTGDEMKLPQIDGPEVELITSSLPAATDGLTVNFADSVTIRNICIHSSRRFDLFIASSLGTVIEQNIIGSTANSFTVPAIRTGTDNVRISNASRTGIARNNLVGFASQMKMLSNFSNAQNVNWEYLSNECVGVNNGAGIAFNSNAGGLVATTTGYILMKGNLIRNNGPAGISADLDYNPLNSCLMSKLIVENTIRDNTSAGIQAIQGDGNDTIRHNLIYNSGVMGIRVSLRGSPTNKVKITQNSIYDNGTLGIDLDEDGVTANNGVTNNAAQANFNIDYPIITLVALSPVNSLYVQGFVGSAPNQTQFANAVIEVFKGKGNGNENGEVIFGDGSSVPHLEGERYLGTLIADANGNFSGILMVSGINAGDGIVATATDALGNTSEFGASYFTQGIVVLPLTIRNFSATKKDNSVLINWATAEESIGQSFIIERSFNNRDFFAIGKIAAKGNSSGNTYYGFTDNQPQQGINYYRLKQNDVNGKATCSEVKTVNFGSNKGLIGVYPNPASDFIFISLPWEQKNIAVTLFNSNGQLVSTRQFNNVDRVQIPASSLSKGNYFIEVIADGNKYVSQISINK